MGTQLQNQIEEIYKRAMRDLETIIDEKVGLNISIRKMPVLWFMVLRL